MWAPAAGSVSVEVAGTSHPMAPDTESLNTGPGWWAASVDCAPGQPADYAFRLDGGEPLPDPRSRRQPSGPLGYSRVFDPGSFPWSDASWRGAPLSGAVIYELHVGTFTPAGTLDAAIDRLPYLRDLGVTAVELMPLASFPGTRGWGYDGIGLFAVHEPYGGPAALQRFVDAAHGLGLAVLLDVVYNHVGPGSRLDPFGPYFTSAHTTPWGSAINLDQAGSDEIRSFITDNALMWLRDFHVDGLRLDAVHALEDRRAVHILEALAAEADALAAATGRCLVLIAESDRNDPRLITRRPAGGYGLDGQWSDDFHHSVHAAVTGERQGYYADFGSMAALAKVFTRAYFHDGTWSSFRGRSHGRPVDALATPSYRFVVFAQDHDQVGNRAVGDRLAATLAGHPRREGLLRVAAGLVLLSPFTPMLFMGEEWGADTPWQYFTDHTDPMFAAAVSEGRRSEFAAHGWGFADVPDPQDPATFERSKLDWSQRSREPHASLLAWYRSLLELRRSRPELTDPYLAGVSASFDEQARWLVVRRGPVSVAANLGESPVTLSVAPGALLAASARDISLARDSLTLPPASLAVTAPA
ncbi:MAG: malto-oligosyltrehalose trehalohydrolase [Nocardiopsaceae bacterium]|nr:malto-oligosyltrehalose trehalohydrolase [Nocardiopsaceae bacterium]